MGSCTLQQHLGVLKLEFGPHQSVEGAFWAAKTLLQSRWGAECTGRTHHLSPQARRPRSWTGACEPCGTCAGSRAEVPELRPPAVCRMGWTALPSQGIDWSSEPVQGEQVM